MLGKFVSIDGPNGAGKSTVMTEVSNRLQELNIPYVHTKEVTDSSIGNLIHKELDQWGAETLACLISADRYNHIDKVIRPNLEGGKIVISERYFPSSLVYQIKDGCSTQFIRNLNAGILIPDLSIIIFSEMNTIQSRLIKRKSLDKFEEQNLGNGNEEIELYKNLVTVIPSEWNIRFVENIDGDINNCIDQIVIMILSLISA